MHHIKIEALRVVALKFNEPCDTLIIVASRCTVGFIVCLMRNCPSRSLYPAMVVVVLFCSALLFRVLAALHSIHMTLPAFL